MEKQIKSRKRVKDLGEVFTRDKEIKAMYALIPDKNKDFTYLEPACGTGNFLVYILKDKLSNYTTGNIEKFILKAISSLYGIDISPDNVITTRERLNEIIKDFHINTTVNFNRALNIILEKNFIVKDFLNDFDSIKFVKWEF